MNQKSCALLPRIVQEFPSDPHLKLTHNKKDIYMLLKLIGAGAIAGAVAAATNRGIDFVVEAVENRFFAESTKPQQTAKAKPVKAPTKAKRKTVKKTLCG